MVKRSETRIINVKCHAESKAFRVVGKVVSHKIKHVKAHQITVITKKISRPLDSWISRKLGKKAKNVINIPRPDWRIFLGE